jgi:hypothetical protein
VIHVLGVVMIEQGTDGLSRGVWCSPFQDLTDQVTLTAAVFAPLTVDFDLVKEHVTTWNLPARWRYVDWQRRWNARSIMGALSVWFPPPEVARQVLVFILETWCEQQTTTSALLFVPRAVPGFWMGLSKHLQELPSFKPHERFLRQPPLLSAPIIVLYLAPHCRTLKPSNRLDRPPSIPGARWHEEQAEAMRGLPPRPIADQAHPRM